MFEKLIINNFQCHRKLVLDFDEHITTIVGSSDHGKSASLRALYYLCTNSPSGVAFIRHGASDTKIHLKLSGSSIKRHRSRESTNLYILDGKSFTALRSNVPEEIAFLLNIIPDINFQRQQDPPFWFSKTPGEVSRELNQIINLGLIDKTLSNLASNLRQARATVSVSQDRLDKAKENRIKLRWVKEVHEDLVQLESQNSCVEELAQKLARIAGLEAEASRLKDVGMDALSVAQDAEKCIALWQDALALEGRLSTLSEAITSYQNLESKIKSDISSQDISNLEDAYEKYESLRIRLAKIDAAIREMQEAEENLCRARRSASESEKKIQNLNCPLCGQKMEKIH